MTRKRSVRESLARTPLDGKPPRVTRPKGRRVPYLPITPEERQEIIELLRARVTVRTIAARFKRHPASIYRIAESTGIEPANVAPQKAIEARVAKAREERLDLLYLCLEIVDGQVRYGSQKAADAETGREMTVWRGKVADFKSIVICVGILTDKCRQEEAAFPIPEEEESMDSAIKALMHDLTRYKKERLTTTEGPMGGKTVRGCAGGLE